MVLCQIKLMLNRLISNEINVKYLKVKGYWCLIVDIQIYFKLLNVE